MTNALSVEYSQYDTAAVCIVMVAFACSAIQGHVMIVIARRQPKNGLECYA